MSLSMNKINEVISLFKDKTWPINNGGIPEEINLFDNFCEILEKLDEEEQNLFLLLSKSFLKIKFEQYHLLVQNIYNMLPRSLFTQKKFIIFPIQDPSDRGKTKSGGQISYILKTMFLDVDPRLKGAEITAYEDPKYTGGINLSNYIILLVDDFIGTGNTYDAFRIANRQMFDDNANRIYVLALAGMNNSIQGIKNTVNNVYCANILSKGIDDSTSFTPDDKINYKAIMNRIERKLSFDLSNSFGYGNTQALISLMKSPDNTFPVYWVRQSAGGGEWPAPFPR